MAYLNPTQGTARELVDSLGVEADALLAAIPTPAVADLAALTTTSIAATTPSAAPAGGTGDVGGAGGWDTADHRDSAITTINSLVTEVTELKLDHDAAVVDMGLMRSKINDLLAKLRTAHVVTA